MSLPLDEQIIKNFTLKSWPDSNRQFLLQEQYGCKCASLLCMNIQCNCKFYPSKRSVMTASSTHFAVTSKTFTAAFPFKLQDHGIEGRIRTCNLSAPDGGSGQSEYSYILQRTFIKASPLHLTGNAYFLRLQMIFSNQFI